MATTTTKLGLVKPASSDRVDVTGHVSDNFTTLDSRINAFVCTSATHPASPYSGMLIFETDTNNVCVYHSQDGNNYWLPIGNNSWGKGYKASTAITANSASTSGTTELDTGIEVTFDAETGREYLVSLDTYVQLTTDDATIGGRVLVRLRWASGASVGTGDTFIDNASDQLVVQTNNQLQGCHLQRMFVPGVTVQVTVGVFLVGAASHVWNIVGSATANRGALVITDVGAG